MSSQVTSAFSGRGVIPIHGYDREPNHPFFVKWTTFQLRAEPIQFAGTSTLGCAAGDIRIGVLAGRVVRPAARPVVAARPECESLANIFCRTTPFSDALRSDAPRLRPHLVRRQRKQFNQLGDLATAFDPSHDRAAPSGQRGVEPGPQFAGNRRTVRFLAGAGGRDNLRPRSLDGPNVRCRNAIGPDARFVSRINSSRIGNYPHEFAEFNCRFFQAIMVFRQIPTHRFVG